MAIGTLTEEVAANLEEVAEVTRKIDTRAVGYFFGGVLIGAGIGFYLGRRLMREKIRAEAFAQSEQEVEAIRELYQARALAAQPKPSVEEVVEEKGYSTRVTIDPETTTIQGVEVVVPDISQRPLRPSVPVDPAKPVFRTEEMEKDKNEGWVYAFELANRSPTRPFIIHQDEFQLNESEYNQTSYIYYSGDDVLVDEDDSIILDKDENVGMDNLARFGHGTDDYNLLYIRNPRIELEMEISRVPKSYAEEVLGLENETEPD